MKAFTFLQQMQRVPSFSAFQLIQYYHQIPGLYMKLFRPSMLANIGEGASTEVLFDGWKWERKEAKNTLQETFHDPLGKFVLIYIHQIDTLEIYANEDEYLIKVGFIKNATIQTLDVVLNTLSIHGVEFLWSVKARLNYFSL